MAEPIPEKEVEGAYELPEGWVWAKLSDIIEPSKEKMQPPFNETEKYIGLEHIGSNTGRIVGMGKGTDVKSTKNRFYKGDVLYGKLRPYLNKTVTIDFNGICSTDLIVFRRSDFLENEYLMRFLSTQQVVSFTNQNMTGVQHPRISFDRLGQVLSPLPPLAEQHRIVAKLEALLVQVNAAKDHLAAVPPIIKRFRQSVLAAACSGRLTEDWRREHLDVEPASELLKRIQKERIRRYEAECQRAKAEGRRKPKNIEPQEVVTAGLPELPEGWVWTHFNELGELSRGKSKHRPRNDPKLFGGEYPFIQTGDVANSGGALTKFSQTYNEVGLFQSRLFPEGTVCITIAANIAESSILTFPACFPDSVVGFVTDDILIDGKFFEFYIQTIKDDLYMYAPATAQKNINLKILNRVVVPLPSLTEQRAIVNRIETLFRRTSEVEERVAAATAHADRLTQSILAKAFRGELVPQDPDDEPASVLLERIRKERTELKKKKKPQKRRPKTLIDSN